MDMEILPKKSRATSKPKTLPKEEDDFIDIDDVPKTSRASAQPAEDAIDSDVDEAPKPKPAAKAAAKPAAKRGPKPKAKIEEERARLKHHSRLLDPNNADPDMADELVRKDLGLIRPDEVIIPIE